MTEAAASRIIVNAHRINADHLPEPAARTTRTATFT